MAGIGFEIRKILERNTYVSILEAYGLAGIISSGPWVLSVIGVLIIGVSTQSLIKDQFLIVQYLVSVTYLMACSLILTGLLQLMFTRFIADRLFEERKNIILPNLMGAIWLVTCLSFVFGVIVLGLLFDESLRYEMLMLSNFVVLCDLWIVVIFLSSMKVYLKIVGMFFLGYSIAVLSSVALSGFGIDGLLLGILLGHSFLFFGFFYIIIREYPGTHFLSFEFLQSDKIYVSLMFTGLFFNLGVWVDKFVFWFTDNTSQHVIGPLRASIIYDLPIFLAYLSIIPGMAVFLVRMEADFAEQYDNFYNAIRNGDTLKHIQYKKRRMIYTIKQGVFEIFKVQGITVVVLLLWGREILALVGISPLYARLFYVDVVAVSMQVLLLSILNVFFYLDCRRMALFICFLFMVSNLLLTLLSLELGVSFYGYGYAVSAVLVSVTGLLLLSSKLKRLEYETFMLQ
ncbi:histidine kinase [Gammaproteobacteria bacterium 45_16_T64]|nr:histidine kinase [Gammaproteobacteria bacterium 45_16_T64]